MTKRRALAFGEDVYLVNWGGSMYRAQDRADFLYQTLGAARCNVLAVPFAG